ncbi:MAG: hypothetical protein E7077_06245 [Bacteroidales bacterium]|jgi:hypothetical protein|nr:hypothetical protein [Bacteroidales bacterium]
MLEYITTGNWDALVSDCIVRIMIILLSWACAVASSFIDLWSGVDTAKALGESIQSDGLRRTVVKIGDYMRVMLFLLMFDLLGAFLSFYVMPFATMLGALSIILIEGKSVIENSRRKKSNSANIPDVMRQIVNAKNIRESKEVYEAILKELNNTKANENN